ncbi:MULTISPECIES: C2 family cysteine protease [Streptomyces]|uniref:C2 family cysteine protease n=1 Tax=Streptomyces yunnanensis TaxID=156453 RepID=A0ABY8A585_9ACTN|nr:MULTISPECIES: C2 family cysteine protease [Streptomyces]WEB40105.1 C2 family cysteine protease [Streptomyces yunnanensis]
MGYGRNNWRQVAGFAADFIPGGGAVLGAVDLVRGVNDSIGLSRLNYVKDGHPLVELPWQPPGPPPNPQRAEAVGGQAWNLLFADETRYNARSLLDQVANLLVPLPPTELDMVVRRWGQQGLERWDDLTHVEDEHGEPAYDWRRQAELFSWLLRSVSPYTAMLVGTWMVCSQPEYDPGCACADHGWVLPEGPFAQVDGAYFTQDWKRVSGSTEAMSWQDMDQGRFGTCWFLTSIQGVIQANPQHAARHLRLEANGTVTCTLYVQGRPVDITMVPDLPYGHNMLWCAKGHTDDARYAETWPGYYEKAVAKLRGGYEQVTGGFVNDAFGLLTGREPQPLDYHSPWLCHEIADRRARGQAVAVGTWGRGNDREKLAGGRLATSHAYFVKDVDVAGGRICLGNPWGDGATRKMWECWLTLDEVRTYLNKCWAVETW